MPAYDFEDVFRDNKDNGLQPEKEVAPQRAIDDNAVKNLNRSELFEYTNKNLPKSFLTGNAKIFENAKQIIEKTPEFKFHQYDTKDEKEQRVLRTKLVVDFLSYIQPELKKSLSFQFSPEGFKGLLVIPAIILVLVSLFLPVAMISFSIFICGILLYMQLHNGFQIEFFEKAIWSSIQQIPEEQLKQVLHSVLSNNYLQDEYTEDEIKEIIFNFMYSEEKIPKMVAHLKIREAMRDLLKVAVLKDYA